MNAPTADFKPLLPPVRYFKIPRSHWDCGSARSGTWWVRKTVSVPSGCRGYWAWAAITRLGHGCISCDEPWYDLAETVCRELLKWMKPTSVEKNQARGGAERLARL